MSNPDDRPTEQFGRPTPPDQPTEIYHTSDPYQAYGEQPPPNTTMPYPTYQTYDPNQPPPNPTQAYPPYQGQPYPGQQPPQQPPPEPPRKSNTWVWVLAGLVVLALVGVVAFVATSGSPDSTTADSSSATTRTFAPTTIPAPRTAPRTSPAPVEPGQPGGGLGGAIQNFGATIGNISANDGSTLTVDGVDGKPVTVTTTPQTQVVSLSGTKVSDLKVGDSVVIQGDKAGDGSITARIIISTSLPSGGGFGR